MLEIGANITSDMLTWNNTLHIEDLALIDCDIAFRHNFINFFEQVSSLSIWRKNFIWPNQF